MEILLEEFDLRNWNCDAKESEVLSELSFVFDEVELLLLERCGFHAD